MGIDAIAASGEEVVVMPEPPTDGPKRTPRSPTPRLRFRLVHVFYVMALLGSSLATFGAGGVVLSVVIVGMWTYVFASSARGQALANVCGMLLPFCCCGLLVPVHVHGPEVAWRSECSNNLKQIAIALHNYHDANGGFPPAYVRDKSGKPMHSWRVLILPFIEEQSLYDAYDFDEPWDGPNNRKLASQVPYTYACPTHSSPSRRGTSCASYFAVVSPETAWPQTTAGHLKHIGEADGMSQTILLVEAHLPNVPWTEPRDLSFEEAMRVLTSSDPSRMPAHRYEDFFYDYDAGSNVALADGRVRFLHHGLPRDTAAALLTYNGGEEIGEDSWDYPDLREERLKLANCYRLGVFVALAFFPLPWVWISPMRAAKARDGGMSRWLKS